MKVRLGKGAKRFADFRRDVPPVCRRERFVQQRPHAMPGGERCQSVPFNGMVQQVLQLRWGMSVIVLARTCEEQVYFGSSGMGVPARASGPRHWKIEVLDVQLQHARAGTPIPELPKYTCSSHVRASTITLIPHRSCKTCWTIPLNGTL